MSVCLNCPTLSTHYYVLRLKVAAYYLSLGLSSGEVTYNYGVVRCFTGEMFNYLEVVMRYILSLVLLVFASSLWAESYSNVSTVKGISIIPSSARIQLNSMKEAEGCSSSQYYYLGPLSDKGEMYSTILAAKMSGEKLSFQLTGCQGKYPVITAIYLCDKHFCN